MKISIFEAENDDVFRNAPGFGSHEITCVEAPLCTGNAHHHADAEVISVFVHSVIDDALLQRLPKLRFIATRSTGYDHIELTSCKERGIRVANVPNYGAPTVAEHVFALLLTLSHRMIEAIDRTRRGDFSLQGLRGFDLRGKTIGVVGTGSIGRCVIEIASGFSMRVLACDIAPDIELAERFGFDYVKLDELLAASDIVTLHVPLISATHHLIGASEFATMKDGVVLINTARGDVVDVTALLHALTEGKVAAAGLDVLPEEPAIREEAELLNRVFAKEHNLETLLINHILIRMRNVVITPHNAFNTVEAVQRINDITLNNILSFQEGKPVNLVS